MSEKVTVTFYSTNEENFEYENIGDVIDALDGEHENLIGIDYYSCEFKPVVLADYLNVDSILEDADQYLYDNVGNDDGDFDVFTSVTDEAKQELKAMLRQWADKHVEKTTYYESVGKVTTHTVQQSDVE